MLNCDGFKVILSPVPIHGTPGPPQPTRYQSQRAPEEAKLPPTLFKVKGVLPGHTAKGPEIPVACLLVSATVNVKLPQGVELQLPSALTKYVYVPGLTGFTVSVFPVPWSVPPQLPEYHFQLAAVPKVPPFTVKVLVDPRQIEPDPDIDPGFDTSRTLMVMLTHFVVLQLPSALR